MDKNLLLTASGKAGRISGVEIQRKSFKKDTTHTLKGPELSKVLCKIMSDTPDTSGSCSRVKSEINVKLRAYSSSDASRSLPGGGVPSYEQICERMIQQKYRCYYCHSLFHVLYKNKRDPLQWSVDRIDNSKSHCQSNIVISCMSCNLRRRTRDSKEFYDCRNLQVEKTDAQM